ncbi:fungal-specific transcription factor domain-containing protein [Xylogone sp. PMI_703]|nr:fungal-specific transcription factor domain-containing protein [Xylogone sp. PMI_703]
MDRREIEKRRRRVPPDLRRRALMSCDRCKKRRIKCLRSDGNDYETACKNCIDSGSLCESTLPRKQRVYGSIEKTNSRYRILDALVKRHYPGIDTGNIDALRSIELEGDADISQASHRNAVSNAIPTSPESTVFSQATPDPLFSCRRTSVENPFMITSKKILEERLIPSSHGPSHYIGPSSSFGFVIAVRHLVAEVLSASKINPLDNESAMLQSDFAVLNESKALELHSPKDELEPPHRPAEADPEPPIIEVIAQREERHQSYRTTVPTAKSSFSENSKIQRLSSILPEKEVADSLVDAYFDQVHSNYLLFHRGTFKLRYESIWADKKQIQDIEIGWLCCVFMILVFGAQVLEQYDIERSIYLQKRYLGLVQSRADQLIMTTNLTNIQALLLLQLHQHNASERNAAWMLLGCATRMAMSLGMHREGATGGFDSIEKEVRKRVWWTIYTFEKSLGLILGRPSSIDDAEVNISLPNETLLDGNDVPPDYIHFYVQLTKISSEIKRKIYHLPPCVNGVPESPAPDVVNRILLDLNRWYCNLPPYLGLEHLSPFPKHRRAILLLHIQHRHLQVLVTRPFLLRKIQLRVADKLAKKNRPLGLDRDEEALSCACGTYSKQIVHLLHQLTKYDFLDGVTWLDMYYFFHSVFILSVDFLARPNGQADTQEDIARKLAVRDIVDAVHNKKLCPTFSILTQVALQLAKIVGIFNNTNERLDNNRRIQQSANQEASVSTILSSQGNFEDIFNQVFQDDTVDLSWDFLGTDPYGAVEQTSFYNSSFLLPENFTSTGGDNFGPNLSAIF